MDNGTGYTKIGYAGCYEPNFVFPTCIAEPPPQTQKGALDDLDFYIGSDAADMAGYSREKYQQYSPMKHGMVENWDQMEKLWQQSIYKYLRCEPEEHSFILTESPYNPPENREYTAEIMFETFGVSGLNISMQAVLALAATWGSKASEKAGVGKRSLTGTVIDSGDGVTHIIPVYEGYIIQSGIKHIGLAGKDITKFIFDIIKDREVTHPEVNMMLEAQRIKEEYGHVCADIAKEFAKYDAEPSKYIQKWSGVCTGKTHHRRSTHTRCHTHRLFRRRRRHGRLTLVLSSSSDPSSSSTLRSSPSSTRHRSPISLTVCSLARGPTRTHERPTEMITGCPIHTRKGLYQNVVLSGGSTMFRNFGKYGHLPSP